MLSLFESGEYSDFSIACNDRVFKVHKAIVCPQSPVLAAAINGDFQVGSIPYSHFIQGIDADYCIQEAKTGVVKIDGFDVDTVEAMINFLYGKMTGILQEPVLKAEAKTAGGASTMMTKEEYHAKQSEDDIRTKLLGLVQMNAIADYYDVATLRAHTNVGIRELFEVNEWTTETFLDAANATASSTGDVVLHHMFAEFTAKYVEELNSDHCEPDFDGLVSLKSFAVTLMEHSSSHIQRLKRSLNLTKTKLNMSKEALAKVLETIKEERKETEKLRLELAESKATHAEAYVSRVEHEVELVSRIYERYDAVLPEIQNIRDELGQWATMYHFDTRLLQQRLDKVVRDMREAKYIKKD